MSKLLEVGSGEGELSMVGWLLRYEGFDPAAEGHREALCTLGNGLLSTRGAAPESSADEVHYPGTYVAGLYNRRATTIAGRDVENESIVNVPNWLPLLVRIEDGPWLSPHSSDVLEYVQELDLRRATLVRNVRLRDEHGRVARIEQRRFVSMSEPHVVALETSVTPENWSGRLTIRSGIDGRVVNAGVERYRSFDEHHLVDVATSVIDDDTIGLIARTSQSDVDIAEVARTRLTRGLNASPPERHVVDEPGFVALDLVVDAHSAQPVTVEKIVTIHTSRDRAISDAVTEAQNWSRRAGTFASLLDAHVIAWNSLWRRFALTVEDGPEEVPLALHLHIFHLLQTCSLNTLDLDVSAPARGLHGEAYRGHIFWDELFVFPYLNLHLPELVRSLLLYRYRRLPEARWAARQAGYRGAMYPWQSGSDGREEAQVVHLNPLSGRWLPDASHLQRHINIAVAYNVLHYLRTTGDHDFMATYGAEMLVEISRFWASIAEYNPVIGRYEILGVVGPDEYHEGYVGAPQPGLDNNSYTNLMASWVLSHSLELLATLPEPRRGDLFRALSLEESELSRWDDVSRKMRIIFHEDGIISQFEGYEQLRELDWGGYWACYGDISRLDRILESENDTPNAYKASKQADVLMLFYLLSADELEAAFTRLGYHFDRDVIPRTIEYYLQRTSHGSTLSRLVHSWVLARSDRERSWQFFLDALDSDLEDTQGGTTAEGVHLGAMAGTLDLLQRCYLGIEIRDGAIWFNPLLPTELEAFSLDIRFRNRWLTVSVDHELFTVEAEEWGEGTVSVGVGGEICELAPGEKRQMTR